MLDGLCVKGWFQLFLFFFRSCNFLRLSDVLKRTGLSKDDFVRTHKHIEILSIPKEEFETATMTSLLSGSKDVILENAAVNCYVELVPLDDGIREILKIETMRIR